METYLKAVLPAVFLLAFLGFQHAANSGELARQLTPGNAFQDCKDCPKMVVIPTGEFDMGFEGGETDRYEGPVHHVKIDRPFAVGKFEVTNAEYRAFIKATSYVSSKNCNVATGQDVNFIADADWAHPGPGAIPKDNEPVICVSWNDIKAYVAWLSKTTGQTYRLLSEAEWEYTARAGTRSTYVWGEDPNGGCKVANIYDQSAVGIPKLAMQPMQYDSTGAVVAKIPLEAVACNDGFSRLAPVGSLAANAFGVYDMIGNAWEWVEDCYFAPYAADGPRDGKPYEVRGECGRRVARGGNWSSIVFRDRPSWRGRDPATLVSFIFGSRVARDLK